MRKKRVEGNCKQQPGESGRREESHTMLCQGDHALVGHGNDRWDISVVDGLLEDGGQSGRCLGEPVPVRAPR